MKLEEVQPGCPITCLHLVTEGDVKGPRESLGRKMKLMIRRRLSPGMERVLKNRTNDLANKFCGLIGGSIKPTASLADILAAGLQAGDSVRVRTYQEIQSTLNHWRQLKGCTFMPEMAEYCDTVQRVLKPMKSFVDERDLRLKKSNGIVLLEGVMCKGTAEFGNCDRSCFVFWREEWLEKIGAVDDQGQEGVGKG